MRAGGADNSHSRQAARRWKISAVSDGIATAALWRIAALSFCESREEPLSLSSTTGTIGGDRRELGVGAVLVVVLSLAEELRFIWSERTLNQRCPQNSSDSCGTDLH
jgi:hypothetical protein